MLFTEEWLRQYCNPQLSTEELAETLTMAGLEVEEVTSVAPAFTGVVVAEVLTCRDHENSDHLHVCEVNAGTGETLQRQTVCGQAAAQLRHVHAVLARHVGFGLVHQQVVDLDAGVTG